LDLLPKTQRQDAINGHWAKAELIDYLFATGVQAHFSPEVITVVHDYPANQAALAELCPDGQHAKRFEVFIGPVELANGYQELTDPKEQHARFVADQHAREQHGLAVGPLDRRLLAALEQGMPACSGVALGVDRLIMLVLGIDTICETLTFGAHDSLALKNDPS
ncbi:MAG TPA: amino acid--tRNA ligase-related protein, partial [Wenzhouxiangella sp.]